MLCTLIYNIIFVILFEVCYSVLNSLGEMAVVLVFSGIDDESHWRLLGM